MSIFRKYLKDNTKPIVLVYIPIDGNEQYMLQWFKKIFSKDYVPCVIATNKIKGIENIKIKIIK